MIQGRRRFRCCIERWLKVRSINSSEDSAGDLSEDCQENYSNTDYRRLPITKKCVQREDWGVAARQSVPLAHFHRITRLR